MICQTHALMFNLIEERIAMKDLKRSRGREIVLDDKGRPKAKPPRMSASARIAKRKKPPRKYVKGSHG